MYIARFYQPLLGSGFILNASYDAEGRSRRRERDEGVVGVGWERGGGGEDLERTEERVYALVFDCVC